ncbi:hypothetical protein NMY22_g17882 [Coprinellus aureogranulatus]|nr:hypothetical protein NMY22_g17882 [Coprinellus aureogranulatus]
MMLPALPNELLELCIDHLALKPREDCIQDLISCSLANSALLAQCQRYIFHTVYLWVYVPVEGRPPSAETLDYHRRSQLLIRTITCNPSLGLHVRRLSHRVTSIPGDNYEELDVILHAFELMPNVLDFELGHRRPEAPLGSWLGPGVTFKLEQAQWRWNGGISAIIGNPQLRTLRLEDVFAMPIDQLPSGLHELHLRRATFGNALNERRTSTRKRKQIQVLTCDTLSALSLGVYYKEDLTPFGVDLSQLKKLSFHLQLRAGTQLIRQSRCLEELELTILLRRDSTALLFTSYEQSPACISGHTVVPHSL